MTILDFISVVTSITKTNISWISPFIDNKIENLFKILKTSDYYQAISELLKEKKTKYLNKQKLLINGNERYWNVIFEPMLEINLYINAVSKNKLFPVSSMASEPIPEIGSETDNLWLLAMVAPYMG